MVTNFQVNKMCKATFSDGVSSHRVTITSDDDLFLERASHDAGEIYKKRH